MSRILKITRYLIPQLCSLFFVYFTGCEYFLRQKCVREYLVFDAFDLQANNEIFWPAATGTRVLRNLIPSRAQLPLSVSTPQNALILPSPHLSVVVVNYAYGVVHFSGQM